MLHIQSMQGAGWGPVPSDMTLLGVEGRAGGPVQPCLQISERAPGLTSKVGPGPQGGTPEGLAVHWGSWGVPGSCLRLSGPMLTPPRVRSDPSLQNSQVCAPEQTGCPGEALAATCVYR